MKWAWSIFLLLLVSCASVEIPKERLAAGKAIAFDRNQGNCLACHKISDGELPGNVGPELTNQRIHDKSKKELFNIIWDASRFNPNTSMPPYGRNKVLSNAEIESIVDYLWSLP